MKFRTRSIHVGNSKDPETGAVVPPIHVASTFVQPEAGEWGEFDYSRSGNPTRRNLEATMTSLEGGVGALAFATGMAATHCVTMLCQPGDKIVAGADIYGGTYRLFHKIVTQAGVSTTLVDSSDLEKLSAAVTDDTRIVWIESPGNPLLSITDIASVARIAHRHGAILAVDSTFATPALSRPLEHGADIVMHSATKFLGGHSDAMGGILVARVQDTLDQLYFRQNATGATLGSFDCFLISRGIKTLDLRIRTQSASALEISSRLAADSRVARVFYPGLPSHPGHELAAEQMDGAYGGVVSFEVAGDFSCAKKVVDSTELFQLAVSLGAVESLIEQPAAMSHASYDAEDRALNGITDSLVRISVGLEDLEDLWDDLQQALSQ
jgi:cystathionine beta-lyase/cystathionine gamma-synthase